MHYVCMYVHIFIFVFAGKKDPKLEEAEVRFSFFPLRHRFFEFCIFRFIIIQRNGIDKKILVG